MAVNARDVLLQGASPRFLGVQVGSNIQVPIVNIPGLSTALDNTREVRLTGTSQVYQIPKTGAISPTSITVSAVLRNLTGTPTLTLTNGTMSVTPALTSGVFTFTPAEMTSDTITLRLSLTVGPDTFTDDWTVVKVREGADGVTGFLTNESFTVAADYLGNVTTMDGVNGNFKVFQGTTDVTTACTFSIPTGGNPDGITGAGITASGAGAGYYSFTGGFSAGLVQTAITLRATFGSMTIDKVFSLAKSKAGAAGGAGGTGPAGARGSQTFYVAISGSSYSDSVATATASVGGGPIYGDVVTQYNNSAGFALSKFWDGSSSWVTINAVVDGNLLVQGTVGAQKLIVNNGSGNNLWWDANYQQPDQWTPTGNGWGQPPIPTTTTAGKSSQYIMWSGSNTGSHARFKNRVPVTVGKQYRMSVWVRGEGSPNGTVYFRLDGDNVPVSAYNQIVTGAAEGSSPGSGTWVQYTAVWTATYPYVGAMLILNYTGTTGYMIAQDIRIEELMDSALIVTGGITADRIDSRGLSIKDGAGNIILAAGSALDWSNLTAQPAGIYNTNITLSGGAINGIGTGNGTTVANNQISVSLASNAYTINGIGSSGSINIGGLGYTGDLNATVGAPTGTYVAGDLAQSVVRPSNKITSGNVGTYIASAAISYAEIGVLRTANITVDTLSRSINGFTEGTTPSGGRVEITANRVDVYDTSNQRRVRLGLL